jgi:glucose/arabinose dehydrogenase
MTGLLGLQINGRAGNDSISVNSSITLPATLKGGLGDDTLTGGGGDNVLIGGIGNDSLVGGSNGGSGENLLVPDQLSTFSSSPTGNDTLDGGAGYSIADFSHSTDALTLSNDGAANSGDLAAGEKSEIMSNVAAIWGGTANDTITGTQPNEFLSGGGGADSILGGGVNDLLIGGKGADTVLPAAEPVTLFLRDNATDLYDNVNTPSEDTLVLDTTLDMPLLTSPITAGTATATLAKVATVDISTYGTPQDLVSAPGDSTQQFITTRNGYILILNNGVLDPTPLLNISAAGVDLYTGGEGGLLDLAFSPQFDKPGTFGFGKFYTFQTEPFSMSTPADYASPEDYPTTSTLPNNQITIREWTINPNNPDLALTTSRVLLRINHPESNHQGGALRFGPDGDLYIGLGDGGGANDQNGNGPDDPTDGHTNNIGNGQDLTVPFGKILRINPNPHAKGAVVSTNGQYSIPDSNPFIAGTDGDLKEIYAYGLRNPYRMAFDSVTGKLYVSNVGQGAIEQLDLITSGGNYGWPFREGTRDNSGDYGHAPPPGFTFSVPIAEYTHGDGDAGIGGDLYRGTNDPQLDGDYLFGDLNGNTGSGDGRLFYVSGAGGAIHQLTLSAGSAQVTGALYAVTQDSAGNAYYLLSDGSILTIGSA